MIERRGFFAALVGMFGVTVVAKAAEPKEDVAALKAENQRLREELHWIEWANKGNIRLPRNYIGYQGWTQEEEQQFTDACHQASTPTGFDMRKVAQSLPENRCALNVLRECDECTSVSDLDLVHQDWHPRQITTVYCTGDAPSYALVGTPKDTVVIDGNDIPLYEFWKKK